MILPVGRRNHHRYRCRSQHRNARKHQNEDRSNTATVRNQRRSKSYVKNSRNQSHKASRPGMPPEEIVAPTRSNPAQGSPAAVANQRKQLQSQSQRQPARDEEDAVSAALAVEEIVERIVGHLPSKERQRSCLLVCKLWKRVVTEARSFPLVLRIEAIPTKYRDANHHHRWHPRRCTKRGTGDKHKHRDRDRDDNESKNENANESDDVIWFPLWNVGNLPQAVAARTTKLILVLKFVREHASRIDLNDFCFCGGQFSPFLRRFPNLQDLTIVSEYAADQFVSILGPPSATDRIQIPSLTRIHYEETNASNWRSSTLKAFVELAPNLQVLVLRENILRRWDARDPLFPAESLDDLLPLAGSLRELVLFNRHNIRGNFGAFLERMPLLESWDVFCFGVPMGRWPEVCGKESFQTFEDNACRQVNVNEPSHFVRLLKDETEFLLTLQEMVVSWFLKLDDPNLHPWKTRIPVMVGYLDALVREYFEGHFYEDRPERLHPLPTLQNLLQVVDASPTDESSTTLSSVVVGQHKYPGYCSLSRRETQRRNFFRVVQPCMELCHREFLHHTDFDRYGYYNYNYNALRALCQKWQLRRLVRRISLAQDRYRRTAWLETRPARDDFRVLV